MRRRAKILLAAGATAAAALALAACGGDEGEVSDLARFAPAEALFFVDLAVRPEGELKDDVESILGRFPGGDRVGGMLVERIDESLREEGLTYAGDIEPWLGERAAIWGTGADFQDGELEVPDDQLAFAVETTDSDRAIETLRSAAEREGEVSDASYRGIDYFTASGGAAGEDGSPSSVGAVDGAVLAAGSEDALRAAIDTVEGDDALSETDEWGEVTSDLGENAILLAYADLKPILDLAAASGEIPREELEPLQGALASFQESPVLASFEIEDDKGTIELSTAETGLEDDSIEQSSVLGDVASDAWLGFGLANVGNYVDTFIRDWDSVEDAEFDAADAERTLRRSTGIELSDLTGLGDAAFYVAGRSLFELQLGAVVEVSDAGERDRLLGAARRAVARSDQASLRELGVEDAEGFSVIPQGLPVRINFAASEDRLVVATGDRATEELLEGDGDSDVVERAEDALGDDFAVNLFLEIGPIVALAEAMGAGDEPGFRRAKPYLDAFEQIAVGSRREGGRDVSRIVVELD